MASFEPDRDESKGRRGLILPLAFLVLSTLLLVVPPAAQERVSSVLRGSALAPFLRIQESLHQARLLSESLGYLRLQLDSTLSVLHSQSAMQEENRRLRALLDLRDRSSVGFLAASAIRSGTQGSESMFLLDVGSADGVEVNDPVVVADGLIGMIREVGPRSALAMDWTHPDFRVSGMTLDGEVFGIVEPRRGAFREEDRLILNGVPFHTPVEDGVPVVTSGRGAVYPRGILVGTIAGLAEIEAGWRRSYWLEPSVRPGSATHVLVLTEERSSDSDPLEELWLPGERPLGPGR